MARISLEATVRNLQQRIDLLAEAVQQLRDDMHNLRDQGTVEDVAEELKPGRKARKEAA